MADTSIVIKDANGVLYPIDVRSIPGGDTRQVLLLGDGENAGLISPATEGTLQSLVSAITAFENADHTDLAALLTQLTSLTTADHADLAALLAGLGPIATQTTLAAILAAGAGDVANTLTDGRKTSTTPGTAVPLVAVSTPCKWVAVNALTNNQGQVNVGGSTVLATSGSSTGTPLAAGQSTTIPVNDAAKVYLDVRTSGDGVSFTWAV